MSIPEMLGQSGVLAFLGMGIVFGFLIIMIIAVTLTGKIIHALHLDKDLGAPPARTGSAGPARATVAAAAITAAISAAVNEYRKDETR